MNKIIILFLLFGVISACSFESKEIEIESINNTIDSWAKKSSIYEVNIRQYTPEGTIAAFIPHLDRLKKLGVDILWIMPLQPIGAQRRKGNMGSYYSIKDYTTIKADMGSNEDFMDLVDQAHSMGFKVIFDWVANHTAWDHKWISKHPSYYTSDSAGNSPIVPPGTDWTDVAQLNYENQELQEDMIEAMKFWVENFDIDGFRCDQAGLVPLKFWKRAVDSLNAVKPVFMLAEWQDPMIHEAFHMTYTWEFHHELKKIAEGGDPQSIVKNRREVERQKYPDTAYRMVFLTNHDENAFKESVFQRYGKDVKPLAVLTFTLFGMPLVYSGQEVGMRKSLRFFEKDTIQWTDSPFEEFYRKLLDLHESTPAMWNAEYGANAEFIRVPEGVIGYERILDGEGIYVYINFNDKGMSLRVEQTMNDYMKSGEAKLAGDSLYLPAKGYYIGTTMKD